MPIVPPSIDDRSFEDLVEEMLARIPAHTPEWTNPREGDPGRTLIDLFAWLTDTLLYRANLIPERQRLAFLRLLGIQMRSSIPARGLVRIYSDDETATRPVYLPPLVKVKGPVVFETTSELTVLPVTAEAYYKRDLSDAEKADLDPVVQGLQSVYQLSAKPTPYVTTPIFAGGAPEAGGFDIVERTVDKCLWLALLGATKEVAPEVKDELGKNPNEGPQLISVGVMPTITVPALFENIGPRARIPAVWEISTGREINGEPEYLPLTVVSDSTDGLTKRGVLRLALPNSNYIGKPANDVRDDFKAGVGRRPPRLDAAEKADRLIAWLRLRPTEVLHTMSLSWVGINAVEIDQRETITGRLIGQSDGTADQEKQLPGQSVETETLEIQVEEPGQGYQTWRRIDDLALAGPGDAVFALDGEAGTIRLGNDMRGRIPEAGMRIRVATMRAGGSREGNLPPGSLTELSDAQDSSGAAVTALKVAQDLPCDGGEDAESLAQAEKRIPALFRHRDRAVTEEDYRRLAADTPGVRLGRVMVLPRFKPHQRQDDVPGVVSVMVLPFQASFAPPNPRPDRYILESVFGHLDARRPLGTELYVIGCQYVELGISVGVKVLDGFGRNGAGASASIPSNGGRAALALPAAGSGRDSVLSAVREALFRFLWPLSQGGVDGAGWQLGRPVRERELEVVVARVPGVDEVKGVKLFEKQGDIWRELPSSGNKPAILDLKKWQLPELVTVVVVADQDPPGDLMGVPGPFVVQPGEMDIAVPVVPDVCRLGRMSR